MSGKLVDAHCHLSMAGGLHSLPSPDERDAGYAGRFVAVTNHPRQWQALRNITEPRVTWAIGLHPCEAHGPQAVEDFLDLAKHSRAVGEVGLDGTPGCETALPTQRDELARILMDPFVRRLYVSLHSRKAVGPLLEHLADARLVAGTLHWFTGTPRQAEKAAALGAWFSVNASMARAPETLRVIPRDRTIVETDAPFGGRGRPRPAGDLRSALEMLAKSWNAPRLEVVETLLANQQALARLASADPFGNGVNARQDS